MIAKQENSHVFLPKKNECAKRTSGTPAKEMVDSLLSAKLPPTLKRSKKLADSENGTYDQIVAHLERDIKLSGVETHRE